MKFLAEKLTMLQKNSGYKGKYKENEVKMRKWPYLGP
jgi:hypothetical protein